MATNTSNHSQPSAEQVLAAVYQVLRNDPETLAKVQAALEPKSEEPTCGKDDGPIWLRITPTVQRNYERRGIFPQFRPSRSAKTLPNGSIVFYVTVEQAEEVLQDAQEQRQKNDGPRGAAAGFTSLIYALERSIRAEKFRGCIEFPGAEKVIAERRAASAIFKVGDRVTVWRGDRTEGAPATIVGPYDAYFVRNDDGTYISNDERVKYCQGYRASYDNGEIFFFYAWQLAPIGESYGHLRLVR